MKKAIKRIIGIILILFLSMWGISILRCEILTYCYGNQFNTIYQENTMIGEIDYLKVLDYSDSKARIYYVSKGHSSGNILVFSKKTGKWDYEKWEKTVWSKSGSADGFIWPYIR